MNNVVVSLLIAGLIASVNAEPLPWRSPPMTGWGPGGPHIDGPGRRPPPHGGPAPHSLGPAEAVVIAGLTYLVLDGVFYRHSPAGYVAVDPPPGTVIDVLPPRYRQVVVPPYTYYVIDGTYYRWDERLGAYRVVTAPSFKEDIRDTNSVTPSKIFVYPRKGQSKQQTTKDRHACHLWAVEQTSIEPGYEGGSITSSGSDYRRALEACLDARGYTIR